MTRLGRISERLGLDPRALLGLLVLVGGTLLWVFAFTGGINGIFSSSTHPLKADFNSIEDIVKNDPVRVNGVQVGSVKGSTVDADGKGATLSMSLDSNAPTIYRNAHVNILWRTALGANDAVSIDPGTPAAGKLGDATLPKAQDSNQVELDQVTQGAFQGGAQSGTRTAIQQLGIGFDTTPQILSNDFNTLATISPAANTGIGAIRGQIPDTDLKNLVVDAGQAARAITVGTNGQTTRLFVQDAATTLSALSANQPDLSYTLSTKGLGIVVPLLYPTFTTLNRTLNNLDPLVAKLTPEVGNVAPTLADLHPTLDHADTLLKDATPLLKTLKPTVESVANTAKVGVPVIQQLYPSLKQLEYPILPALNEKYAQDGGRPLYSLIGPTLSQLNIANFFNSNGDTAAFTLGPEDLEGVQILPCTIDFKPGSLDFLTCQSLADTLSEFLTGGTSLLGSLVKRPAVASVYKPYLKTAEKDQSLISNLEQTIDSKFPSVGKLLFHTKQVGGS